MAVPDLLTRITRIFSWVWPGLWCTGDPHSNWAWFEKQKAAFVNLKLKISLGDLPEFEDNTDLTAAPRLETSYRKLGPSIITEGAKIGKSSDFWHRYKEDIQRAKEIGGYNHYAGPEMQSCSCSAASISPKLFFCTVLWDTLSLRVRF